MEHTYYIPAHKRVYGDRGSDHDTVALLYATYMRFETGTVGRYDCVSLTDGTNGIATFANRLRVVVGCEGQGTGKVFDVVDGRPVNP